MRTEYFLTCKKSYYSDSGATFTFFNFLKKALFVKGKKYKVIKDVISGVSGISGVGGVSGVAGVSGSTIASNPPYSTSTTTCTTTTSTTYPPNSYNYNYTNYTVNGFPVAESFLVEYFYTIKEERQMKLMKLNKISHEEVL